MNFVDVRRRQAALAESKIGKRRENVSSPGLQVQLPSAIAEESRTCKVLNDIFFHILRRFFLKYRIFLKKSARLWKNLFTQNCNEHPAANKFLMNFIDVRRRQVALAESKIGKRRENVSSPGLQVRLSLAIPFLLYTFYQKTDKDGVSTLLCGIKIV